MVGKEQIQIKSYLFEKGVSEHHLMIHVADKTQTFQEQIRQVFGDYRQIQQEVLPKAYPVFMRVFLSDSANQADEVAFFTKEATHAVSVIEQPPLDGSKIALWVYLQTEVEPVKLCGDEDALACGLHAFRHGCFTHWWGGGMVNPGENSERQTYGLLAQYARCLEKKGMNLLEHCVRTWFFVQNVDVNYGGVVSGRNRLFAEKGLTTDTHFISSTGIGGRKAEADVLAVMDTYAVEGLLPHQMGYLYAPTHLNPTAEYGVSFERGTYINYGDRRHLFISGTASIDNHGNVVHPGDVRKQVERMWENVETLLAEGGAGFKDVASIMVYLRDVADYALVNKMFRARFPDIPYVILWAPVCRPGWLVEMECMALLPITHSEYPDF